MHTKDNVLICFGGVSSQCCTHGSLQWCSVKHAVCISRVLQGLYSFHPISPVHSPALVVPSSYCSSYRNIKKVRFIQDWCTKEKTHSKHVIHPYLFTITDTVTSVCWMCSWEVFHEHENTAMGKNWKTGNTIKIMLMLQSCHVTWN